MSQDTIPFNFDIDRTPADPPLQFRVLLDGVPVYVMSTDSDRVQIEINDTDDVIEHELIFEMSNKQPSHTKIDDNNQITEDALILIKNISIDNINVDQLWYNSSQYKHNYNGSSDMITDEFYGSMGCNGTVSMKFTTPFYLWLLEHM